MKYFLFILGITTGLTSPAFGSEKIILKKYPKLFTRSGAKLEITLESSKISRAFSDNSNQGESYVENKLFAYYPKLSVALLQHFYNEGGDYTLLSLRTGTEIKIAERPIWNKAGDLFVSVNEGEYAGEKKGLQLGFCDQKECRMILEKDGRYSKVKWLARDRLQAVNRIPAADGGPGLVARVRCTFQRKSRKAICLP